MTRFLLTLLAFCGLQARAQEKNIDDLAASIPEANAVSVDALSSYISQHFTTDSSRVRAVYVWIASHISYDVPRLKAREKDPNAPAQPVSDVLKTRSAVCQGYSELFVALCKSMGIDAVVVGGYTKQGNRISPVPHAWVAAKLDSDWQLYDPTWGAGFVQDDRFVRSFTNRFYRVPAARLIADHMPFDPMYQFLSQPLTPKEFIDGRPAASNAVFRYTDSIQQYNTLSSLQQKAAELRRLEAAGIQNDMLLERQRYLQQSLLAYGSKDAFDEGGKTFMKTVEDFKEYIAQKNKQFSSLGDYELRQMMDSMEANLKLARSLLSEAEPKTDGQRQAKAANMNNIERFWIQLNKEKDFVQQYLSASAEERKKLFMRR